MFDLTPYDRSWSRFFPEHVLPDWMWNRRGGYSFDVDVKELDSCYVLEADLPGVKMSDISVDYENRYLIITARQQRKKEDRGEAGSYLRQERFDGEMRRSFYFDRVNREGITAGFNDGVLKVTLPKDAAHSDARRSIPVNRPAD